MTDGALFEQDVVL